MLKLFAWEISFERRVAEARGQEVRCILKMAMLYLVLGICSYMLSFLVSTEGVPLAGAATSIIFVAIKRFVETNMFVCRDKTRLLSRQKYACHDKTFVATKLCLSQQSRVCHDKSILVATNTYLS